MAGASASTEGHGWAGLVRSPVNLVWASLLVAATVLYDFGTQSPIYPRWLVIYVMAALAGAFLIVHLWRAREIRFGFIDLAVLGFVAYAAQSVLWSADWREGLFELQNLIALAAVFLYVRHARPRWIPEAAMAGMIATFVLVVVYPADNGGHGNPNFATEFLLIAFPLACGLRGLKWLLVPPILAASAFYLFYVNDSAIEWLVILAVGAILAVFLMRAFKWAGAWIFGGLAAVFAGTVTLFYGTMPAVVARTEIFTNTIAMWLDRPFFGHGLGSFNAMYPKFREVHLGIFPDMGTILPTPIQYAGHAHNELLQGLAELGIAGMVLAGVFLVAVLRRRRDSRIPRGSETKWYNRQGFSGGAQSAIWTLIVVGVIALIEFPLQNPATAVLVAVALGVVAQRDEQAVKVPNPATLGLSILTGAAAVALPISGVQAVNAERNMAQMRNAWDVNPLYAFKANMAAHDKYPLPYFTRFHMALSLANLTRRQPVAIQDLAADRVYQISRSASPHSPAVLLARAEYLLAAGRDTGPEIDTLLQRLKRQARIQPGTWITEAVYAIRRGDTQRALHAVVQARKLDLPPFYRTEINKLAAFIATMAKKENTT